jgi:hypothetical protein
LDRSFYATARFIYLLHVKNVKIARKLAAHLVSSRGAPSLHALLQVMDELGSVLPAETKTQAIATMRNLRSHFRPMKPGE